MKNAGRPVDTSHLRGWKIVCSSPRPEERGYWESVFTLGNGLLGVRGSREEADPTSPDLPMTLMAEVYDRPARQRDEPPRYRRPSRLVNLPAVFAMRLLDGDTLVTDPATSPVEETTTLDMRAGTLTRVARFEHASNRLTRIESCRLVSMHRPNVVAIRYRVTPLNYSGRLTLSSMLDARTGYPDGIVQTRQTDSGSDACRAWHARRTLQTGIEVATAARHALHPGRAREPLTVRQACDARPSGVALSFRAERGRTITVEKIVSIHNDLRQKDPLAAALAEVAACPGFAALAREQAEAWAACWRDADIVVQGDRVVQTMARFFVFHLLQCASRNNVRLGLSASIPAKGLTGPGYNGHVFWDTEIYMLPFFSRQYPEIAASLLQYRHDRLEAARRNATTSGAEGARFPWESADSGREECPKWLPLRGGYVRWRGGEQEIHISADVPMGYHQHVLATGDRELLHGPALETALETARYWATVAKEARGTAGPEFHIRSVIGPDEYHSGVDDSVYTNAMAAWNLRWAADLLDRCAGEHSKAHRAFVRQHGVTRAEVARWRDIANRLHIGFNPATGLYEQFEGYFRHPRQQIKQADVLLLLHLLPELSSPEIFLRNFNRYFPVTLHASSLSPALHVLFSLDCGRPEKAYPYLRMACEVDGVRRGDSTDAGLHTACLGAGWTAIVAGFGGVRVRSDHLSVAPRLPRHWKSLAFSTLHHGVRLRFAVTPKWLVVTAEGAGRAIPLEVGGRRRTLRPGQTLRLAGDWRLPPPRSRPRPTTPVRAVLFDLDGVVVSTDGLHYRAWKALADSEGIPFDAAVNDRLRGVSRMESLAILLEQAKRDVAPEQRAAMAERKNETYRALLSTLDGRDVLPGVLLLLDHLRERGIKTAVASSSRNAGAILERIGLAKAFDAVVDGNDLVHSKPAPEVFLKAARALRTAPARCLVIEDAAAGVEAAHAAGMPCLAVGAAAGHVLADQSRKDLYDADVEAMLALRRRRDGCGARGASR